MVDRPLRWPSEAAHHDGAPLRKAPMRRDVEDTERDGDDVVLQAVTTGASVRASANSRGSAPNCSPQVPLCSQPFRVLDSVNARHAASDSSCRRAVDRDELFPTLALRPARFARQHDMLLPLVVESVATQRSRRRARR